MTHTDNFDAEENETLDGEFDQAEMEAAPEEGEAEALPPKKSGGAGKFVALLAVLLVGGGVGAAKLGLLPIDIPGLTPAAAPAKPAAPAHTATAAPAPSPAAPPAASAPPPMPAPAPESNMAALPPPLGTPAPATNAPSTNNSALSPATGPDAAVPPFGAPPADAHNAAPANKKSDNTAFMPEGIPHNGGPATIAPPEGSMLPPPVADGAAKPEIKSPETHKADNNIPGVPSMPAVTPAPVSADALSAPVTSAPPAAAPAASAAESEKVQKLEERIATLEKTIADLKAGMASKSDVNDLRESLEHMSTVPAAASTPATATPTPAATGSSAPKAQKSSHRAAARHSTASVESEAKATTPAPVATSHRWILKAATPNMAWVAAPGSSEIKTITVGSVLPGLGKITAVNKDSSGRWVVLGTRGKINQ